MRQALLKVYAAFWPADAACLRQVTKAGAKAIGCDDWLSLEGDLLRFSWEGAYFPLEEMLDALAGCLPPHAEGKLDYLDIQAWTLTRCLIRSGDGGEQRFEVSGRSLNHVLDYSGH